MPKLHKRAAAKDVAFRVAQWQSKSAEDAPQQQQQEEQPHQQNDGTAGASPALTQLKEEPLYREVSLPLVANQGEAATTTSSQQQHLHPEQQQQQRSGGGPGEGGGRPDTDQVRHLHSRGTASGWRSRRAAAPPTPPNDPLTSGNNPRGRPAEPAEALHTAAATLAAAEEREHKQGQEDEDDKAKDELEGVAVLAFLPNGSLSGHFVGDCGRCVGLVGQQLMAARECTRDNEWFLLQLHLIDYSSKEEVRVLAQRTGADAASLVAPAPLTEDEAALLPETAASDESVSLSFTCDTILADAAAEAELRRLNPQLCGRGALVNKGTMLLRGLARAHAAALDDAANPWAGQAGTPHQGHAVGRAVAAGSDDEDWLN